MFLESLKYSQEEAEKLSRLNETIHFHTRLSFLKTHRGIRDKKMHILMSPTHGGKSTAVRSVLSDLLINNKTKKILIWLTEETIEEFKEEFCKTFPSHSILDNVSILSEQDGEPTHDEIKLNIYEAIEMTKCDLIFIDNITTSKIYPSGNFSLQEKTSSWLKKLSKKVSLFIMAHSNTSEFSNRFLNDQDIRGGKDIINLTEFLYILQPIMVGDKLFQFINIKKHRGQQVKSKYFRLYYNPVLSIFDKDMSVDFDQIKEVFKQRNKLADR